MGVVKLSYCCCEMNKIRAALFLREDIVRAALCRREGVVGAALFSRVLIRAALG